MDVDGYIGMICIWSKMTLNPQIIQCLRRAEYTFIYISLSLTEECWPIVLQYCCVGLR